MARYLTLIGLCYPLDWNTSAPCSVVDGSRYLLFRTTVRYHTILLSWQTDSDRILSLPVHSSVLEVVLDFLYEDRAVKIEKADDVEFVGNVLVAADQLLISRLVSICESALVALLTLKNVGQILEFADIYNAPQLKTACMHFICLNLPAIAELRLVTLSKLFFYKLFYPILTIEFKLQSLGRM